MYFYYCRFPKTYVDAYVKYGIQLSEKSEESVTMIQSDGYDLFKRRGRVECFKLLAKLLFYLVSGQADILYLKNDRVNPLWKVKRYFDSNLIVGPPPQPTQRLHYRN